MKAGDHVTPAVRLVRPIGSGSMGSVWLAEHLSLGTQVAVKLMTAEYAADPEFVERFEREAQAAARIRSPHVVQVLDYGTSDTGLPFILMELLEGETLRSRIDRLGPLPLPDVVRVVVQAASALGRAHQIGIFHRDIKPENLFLIDVGGEVFVKVLDFGIAKQPPVRAQKWFTETGRMMGTPFYMSPEQLVSAKHVDHRTDVWALAAVAFEALTARRPFQGQSFGDQVLIVHSGGFTRPSVFRPGLPAAIDAWAERALQPVPEARFGSMRELADTLEDAIRNAALAATDPSSPRVGPVVAHIVSPSVREQAAREQAAREQAAREQAVREQAVPEQSGSAEAGREERAHVSAGALPGSPAAARTLVSRADERAAPELRVGSGRVRLVMGNLTQAGTEAIVNLTPGLGGSGTVEAAIRAAGGPELEEELRAKGDCPPGSVVMTGAHRLPRPARVVFHAVGPTYDPGSDRACAEILRHVHLETLRLAEENGVHSIAFPAMSTGRSAYPLGRATPIAFRAAVDHLASSARSVHLVVFVLHTADELMAFATALASAADTLAPRSPGGEP